MLLGTFVGHTDGIWDMALLPLRFRDEALLATASADGTVKVWSTDELGSPLKLSWTYDGTDADDVPAGSEATEEPKEEGDRRTSEGKPVPTSIAVVWTDLKKVAVAYSNSIIKLFELETGKAVLTLKSDETYGAPSDLWRREQFADETRGRRDAGDPGQQDRDALHDADPHQRA